MAFDGFSKDTLKFLGSLARNNNREWFEKNRNTYESEVLGRARDFVVAIADPLYEISPDINAEPRVNAAIRRINRDTRFSPDKTPYKDHLDFYFGQGKGGKYGACYFMRLKKDQMWLGAGIHGFDKSLLPIYRDAVATNAGAELPAILSKVKKSGYDVGGEHYKRVPRGYDADHERADLLRYSGLHAFKSMDIPKEFHTGKLPAFCARHFARLAPLTEWIVTNVTSKK